MGPRPHVVEATRRTPCAVGRHEVNDLAPELIRRIQVELSFLARGGVVRDPQCRPARRRTWFELVETHRRRVARTCVA